MKKTISLRKFNMKSLVVSNFLLERERERERERMLLIVAPPAAFGIPPLR